jgi:hypothetical protein
MFPPLCLVPPGAVTLPENVKAELRKVLTEDEYNTVMKNSAEAAKNVRVRFKAVEVWQSFWGMFGL